MTRRARCFGSRSPTSIAFRGQYCHTLAGAGGADINETALPGLEPVREGVENATREWAMAMAQFAVLFGERFLKALAG
jgi:hypothetical protein